MRRPSAKDVGALPPGSQVAQNLFPGLTFQRIEGAATGEPLSTIWPRLRVERIPTDWPDFRMEPVAGQGQAAPIARAGLQK